MSTPDGNYPEPRPADERVALTQRLDQYRAIARHSLLDLTWDEASSRPLPASQLTIAGIVKHLAWAEDRWCQGRLLGRPMPPPYDRPGADDPHAAMQLDGYHSTDAVLQLYDAACERSRSAIAACDTLDAVAKTPSAGGPVNARWVLVHLIDETARHAGHLDLLLDAVHDHRRSTPES